MKHRVPADVRTAGRRLDLRHLSRICRKPLHADLELHRVIVREFVRLCAIPYSYVSI